MGRPRWIGLALFAAGFVLAAVVWWFGPGACTAVGYTGPPPGGFRITGIEGVRVFYTPDGGVNSCSFEYGVLVIGGLAVAVLGAIVAMTDTLKRVSRSAVD